MFKEKIVDLQSKMTKNLAFVAGIKNMVNLDIDFGLKSYIRDKILISQAVSSIYYYNEGGIFKSGILDRSRLENIEIHGTNLKVKNLALTEFRNKIERCGGFVEFNISGIDVYGRVIVTLFDPITGENLNHIFLKKEYSSVFKKYNKI